MEIKRTTEVLVSTRRRFVIRQPKTSERIFCPQCDEPMLAAEQIAALFDISCRRVYRFVESGEAHFIEMKSGAAFVCPNSLAEIFEEIL